MHVPDEVWQEIFELATWVPDEFDVKGTALEAARGHLLHKKLSDRRIKEAISARAKLCAVCSSWKTLGQRLLFRTIIVRTLQRFEEVIDLVKDHAERQNAIRRIEIYEIHLSSIAPLIWLAPNLRILHIRSASKSKYEWPVANLEVLSLCGRHLRLPPIAYSPGLRILDITNLTFEISKVNLTGFPDLPNLHTVKVKLRAWSYFHDLWSTNGHHIQVLFVVWAVNYDWVGWEDLISDAPLLPNLLHLITDAFPPPAVYEALPPLQVLEIVSESTKAPLNPGDLLFKQTLEKKPSLVRISELSAELGGPVSFRYRCIEITALLKSDQFEGAVVEFGWDDESVGTVTDFKDYLRRVILH